MKNLLKRLGYQGEVIHYVTRKVCGVWFLWIGLITVAGALLGGEMCIHPAVFIIGYAAGFYVCYGNRKLVFNRLATGEQSVFQKKMSNTALYALSILCACFGTVNWIRKADVRTIWLAIFLAVGIHFFFFYFVHGVPVVILAVLCCMYAIVGLAANEIPFKCIGIVDGITKAVFGLYLFCCNKGNNEHAFYRKNFSENLAK